MRQCRVSTHLTKIVSADPNFAPSTKAAEAAARFAMDKGYAGVAAEPSPTVVFVDGGQNFPDVLGCRSCSIDLLNSRDWQHAMDASNALDPSFSDLTFECSTCGATDSLNELDYSWGTGRACAFARWVMRWDGSTEVEPEYLVQLADILETEILVVYAHY